MPDAAADFFIDGQNLFLRAKAVFGYRHPNFDVRSLCAGLAKRIRRPVGTIHFYTGMPSVEESPSWHEFWSQRLAEMGRQGIKVFNPPLRYRTVQQPGPDGTMHTWRHPCEKGVDVRIALDMVRSVFGGTTALVVLSQDNDLGVAVQEVRTIAAEQKRPLEVACAFPVGDGQDRSVPRRGIEGTTWLPMSRAFYDKHLEAHDSRSAALRRLQEDQERRRQALEDPRMLQQRPRIARDERACTVSAVPPQRQCPSPGNGVPASELERGRLAQRVAHSMSAVPDGVAAKRR